MSGSTATQPYSMPMNDSSSPSPATGVLSSPTRVNVGPGHGLHHDSDASDSDEDFEDAVDFQHGDLVGMSDSDKPDTNPPKSYGWSLFRRLCHNINSVMISLGMIVGTIFAYFQYQQQSLSNRMSALQTCLALEQSSQGLANSSFCNQTFQQETRGMGARMMKRWHDIETTESPSTSMRTGSLLAGLWTTQIPVWLMLPVYLLIFAVIKLVRLYNLRYGNYRPGQATRGGPFMPPIHVSNVIPRLIPSTATATGVELRVQEAELRGSDEQGYYYEAQSALTRRMQAWAVNEFKGSDMSVEVEQRFPSQNITSDEAEVALALDSGSEEEDLISSNLRSAPSPFYARGGREWEEEADDLHHESASSPNDQPDAGLDQDISASEAIHRLRRLIRTRNKLDHHIWSLRSVRRVDQPIVMKKARESDATLQEIVSLVTSWDEHDFSVEEWEVAKRIKRQILMPGKRKWEENPPWQTEE